MLRYLQFQSCALGALHCCRGVTKGVLKGGIVLVHLGADEDNMQSFRVESMRKPGRERMLNSDHRSSAPKAKAAPAGPFLLEAAAGAGSALTFFESPACFAFAFLPAMLAGLGALTFFALLSGPKSGTSHRQTNLGDFTDFLLVLIWPT